MVLEYGGHVRAMVAVEAVFLLTAVFLGAFQAIVSVGYVPLGFCSGGVIVVPRDFQKISWAVGNASNGDTISVEPGNYFESQIVVDKTVTVRGEVAESTVVDGGNTSQSVFHVIANDVVIENFTIQDTDPYTFPPTPAIRLSEVTGASVTDVLFRNVGCGVEVRSSNFTDVSLCDFSNATIGILFRDSSYFNVVHGNTLENLSTAVEFLNLNCRYNRVSHNDFVDNTYQLSNFGLNNTFDDGYPSGGNYWSDSSGADVFSGPYQNETGADGMLDGGYLFGLDKYPFRFPLTEFEMVANGSSFVVEVSSNSTLTGCMFNETAITLSLLVQPGSVGGGSCRIAIPKGLLSVGNTSEWQVSRVYLNGTVQQQPFSALVDSGSNYICLSYEQSDLSRFDIKGTTALDELTGLGIVIAVFLASAALSFERLLEKPKKRK